MVLVGLPGASAVNITVNATQDNWINCLKWPEVNFQTFNLLNNVPAWELVVAGAYGSPDGHSEAWFKVEGLASAGITTPSRVSSAFLYVASSFDGVGQNIIINSAPSSWTESNLTCNTAPAVLRNVTYGSSVPYSIFNRLAFNVTDLVIQQVTTGQLNVVLGPASQSTEMITLLPKEALATEVPYLVVNYV